MPELRKVNGRSMSRREVVTRANEKGRCCRAVDRQGSSLFCLKQLFPRVAALKALILINACISVPVTECANFSNPSKGYFAGSREKCMNNARAAAVVLPQYPIGIHGVEWRFCRRLRFHYYPAAQPTEP